MGARGARQEEGPGRPLALAAPASASARPVSVRAGPRAHDAGRSSRDARAHDARTRARADAGRADAAPRRDGAGLERSHARGVHRAEAPMIERVALAMAAVLALEALEACGPLPLGSGSVSAGGVTVQGRSGPYVPNPAPTCSVVVNVDADAGIKIDR